MNEKPDPNEGFMCMVCCEEENPQSNYCGHTFCEDCWR